MQYCSLKNVDPDFATNHGTAFSRTKRVFAHLPLHPAWGLASTTTDNSHLCDFSQHRLMQLRLLFAGGKWRRCTACGESLPQHWQRIGDQYLRPPSVPPRASDRESQNKLTESRRTLAVPNRASCCVRPSGLPAGGF